jgi:tRNA nucleotidyltransferase (CCA-adding enzyme)
MQIYRVGGYVRDKLIGITPHDCDYVVVGSTVEEMIKLGFTQVGRDFPVFLHPKTKEEYALARIEKKTSKGHTGFSVFADKNVTLVEDLSRRDLTINAIAEDMDGNLIDPYSGIDDIKNKIIRHVSSAFTEDPLRILRAARFAAKFGFTIHPDTIQLMQKMADANAGLELSKERIFDEFDKAISIVNFGDYLGKLKLTHNLAIFFPEIDKLFNDDLINQLNKLATKFDRHTILFSHINEIKQITNKKSLFNHHKTTKNLLNILASIENKQTLTLVISKLKIHNQYELIIKILNSFKKILNDNQTASINNLTRLITEIYNHKFNFKEDITTQDKLDIINSYYSQLIDKFFFKA